MKFPIGLGVWVSVGGVIACATSPTGRRQLELVPDEQMTQMGQQAFQQMEAEQPTVPDDAPVSRRIRCIADEVLAAAADDIDRPAKEWKVEVFDSEQINAFALPGGRIGIYRGMVDFAENRSQVAAVMAHEVAHVVADHGNARVSEQMALQGLASIAAAFTEKGRTRDLMLAALGMGGQVGVVLPHSRAQESEADVVGLRYMAEAGFDAEAAVTLWERMAQRGGERPPQFFSTHPHPENRAEQLRARIDEHPRKYGTGASAPCASL